MKKMNRKRTTENRGAFGVRRLGVALVEAFIANLQRCKSVPKLRRGVALQTLRVILEIFLINKQYV
jgi:hypothetical protein